MHPWWHEGVLYHVYPRSFADANGDGVGDLAGIRSRLDHLTWLGVDGIWLSPFYPSPGDDFGYDITDYCDVDPLLGDLDGFDGLLAEAHDRGLRVVVDYVPAHTSDHHPWFLDARSNRDSAHRNWYFWRDSRPGGGPPNNWLAAFGDDEPAWVWDATTEQWYLHTHLASQPDLDWSNPQVEDAMHDVVRFWLDRGVDGFRTDVVHGIGKPAGLPDEPPEVTGLPHGVLNDVPETHAYIRRLRSLIDGYPGDRLFLGEVYLLDAARIATYYGAGDELHLAFDFPLVHTPWDAALWRHRLEEAREVFTGDRWPVWVLSSHDERRHRSRFDAWVRDSTGSEARARAAALLQLTLRGTPMIYQGDELGLLDAEIPDEARLDPGGRDGCRAPIPWEPGTGHGWGGPASTATWLPFPPDADRRNAATLRDDPTSILHLYRRLIAARHQSPALTGGTFELHDAPEGAVCHGRRQGGDERLVAMNFTGDKLRVPVAGSWQVEVASDGVGEGGAYSGTLVPWQAVLLQR